MILKIIFGELKRTFDYFETRFILKKAKNTKKLKVVLSRNAILESNFLTDITILYINVHDHLLSILKIFNNQNLSKIVYVLNKKSIR